LAILLSPELIGNLVKGRDLYQIDGGMGSLKGPKSAIFVQNSEY